MENQNSISWGQNRIKGTMAIAIILSVVSILIHAFQIYDKYQPKESKAYSFVEDYLRHNPPKEDRTDYHFRNIYTNDFDGIYVYDVETKTDENWSDIKDKNGYDQGSYYVYRTTIRITVFYAGSHFYILNEEDPFKFDVREHKLKFFGFYGVSSITDQF